ncbi:MAG: tRNA (adenosine(37)-N6)-threonylcarbamoyltransferase complex ATPase subunit type 1 TsaE [Acidimicrobiales bacterium]
MPLHPLPPLPHEGRTPQHVVRTGSAAETRRLAAALAELIRPGDLIVLSGDLGAGKTTFCQGLGAALGVVGPLTSPTFTLHHRYQAVLNGQPLVVHHLDVYRLDELGQTIELGLPELLDSGSLTLIEWGDNIRPVLPADYLELRMELPELPEPNGPDEGSPGSDQFPAEDQRIVRLRCVGPSWSPRFRLLGERLRAVTDSPAEGDGTC